MGRLILEFEGMFRTSRPDDELGSQEDPKRRHDALGAGDREFRITEEPAGAACRL